MAVRATPSVSVSPRRPSRAAPQRAARHRQGAHCWHADGHRPWKRAEWNPSSNGVGLAAQTQAQGRTVRQAGVVELGSVAELGVPTRGGSQQWASTASKPSKSVAEDWDGGARRRSGWGGLGGLGDRPGDGSPERSANTSSWACASSSAANTATASASAASCSRRRCRHAAMPPPLFPADVNIKLSGWLGFPWAALEKKMKI